MYEESARLEELILQEHDRKNFLTHREEISMVTQLLSSVNISKSL